MKRNEKDIFECQLLGLNFFTVTNRCTQQILFKAHANCSKSIDSHSDLGWVLRVEKRGP